MKLIGALLVLVACGETDSSKVTKEQLERARQQNAEAHRHDAPLAPPTDVQPTLTARGEDEKTRSRETAAMTALYKICARAETWREGTILEATTVEPVGGGAPFVNISAKLARPSTVNGNTLWYRVHLDGAGRPTAVSAMKDVSATSCGLAAAETSYQLADLPVR